MCHSTLLLAIRELQIDTLVADLSSDLDLFVNLYMNSVLAVPDQQGNYSRPQPNRIGH